MAENNRKKIVLVVEDDSSLQQVLNDKLVEVGFDVIRAGTGQEALNRVKEKETDLVLLDIMLPGGINGFDVLEQLKKNPALKAIPVVVLTNLDTEQKTAMDIGAVDYIVKANISIDEVVSKIKNLLQ